MFSRKPQKAEVIRHWYALVPDFAASTQDFYTEVEAELKDRKVPGLEISRVEFSEGGALSDKRLYLRMTRERLVFDVCAARFGTSFFFSCRFAEIPAVIKIWQILAIAIGFYIIVALLWKFLGLWYGTLFLILGSAIGIYLLRNAVAMGLRDLDGALIKSPIVGAIYERFLRRDTYYREDTRLMYCDLVDQVVKKRVEEVTGAGGIKLIRFNDFNPILADLYKPTAVALTTPEAQPEPYVPA
jgi:hypothetical protein